MRGGPHFKRLRRGNPWISYAWEDEYSKWWVRLQSANGQITLTSDNSYFDQWNAERAAEAAAGAHIVVGDSRPRRPGSKVDA